MTRFSVLRSRLTTPDDTDYAAGAPRGGGAR